LLDEEVEVNILDWIVEYSEVLYTTCPVNGNHKKRYHMGFDLK